MRFAKTTVCDGGVFVSRTSPNWFAGFVWHRFISQPFSAVDAIQGTPQPAPKHTHQPQSTLFIDRRPITISLVFAESTGWQTKYLIKKFTCFLSEVSRLHGKGTEYLKLACQ